MDLNNTFKKYGCDGKDGELWEVRVWECVSIEYLQDGRVGAFAWLKVKVRYKQEDYIIYHPSQTFLKVKVDAINNYAWTIGVNWNCLRPATESHDLKNKGKC